MSPLGLYYHDTQYLSGYALRVNGSRPILLRRELGVGHSVRAVSRSVEFAADQLAFLAYQLGLPA